VFWSDQRPVCGGDNTLRAMLLQGGHRLCQQGQRRVRLPGRYDALWIGVLPEGDRVREPLDLDVCHRRRRLHPGPGGLWKDVLFVRSDLRERDLHRLHRLGRRLYRWEHVLHGGRRLHQ
jgi:hypothetical protein